ncbi:hypothetical protein [Candidatus Nitrosocosmicus sp. SS]|uniref:hypothetical protein n=1 Tax=Candidatus Nitrosocosmicus agrestis TaxID=2563600 RepID=UPI00122DF292|nr:hypothetical protein [Candidatus Nitrosocosmicus sp. SS]KAA2283526.1 hypothetical protein F1Z66_01185 [Candidatus Nitrosocosmicus sp. SS]KAF0869606.1 hypothetical protein E5N71_03715 [Candidatus Nitrosocosmicus sp. SS]MDR4490271.1 hypothetical protein [Candidatus Nitrosocosmicus sp.]
MEIVLYSGYYTYEDGGQKSPRKETFLMLSGFRYALLETMRSMLYPPMAVVHSINHKTANF